MTDLKKVPEKDLKAELSRREEIRKEEERQRRKDNHALVEQHIDALLLFVPDHDHTSCDDENINNRGQHRGLPTCKRCKLLCVKRHNVNIDTSVYLDVRIEEDDEEDL